MCLPLVLIRNLIHYKRYPSTTSCGLQHTRTNRIELRRLMASASSSPGAAAAPDFNCKNRQWQSVFRISISRFFSSFSLQIRFRCSPPGADCRMSNDARKAHCPMPAMCNKENWCAVHPSGGFVLLFLVLFCFSFVSVVPSFKFKVRRRWPEY